MISMGYEWFSTAIKKPALENTGSRVNKIIDMKKVKNLFNLCS